MHCVRVTCEHPSLSSLTMQ
uniref:Uncharacterized protein n=1 Tax=Arundo donax TaxID=35708 RepID=A0A0A9A220_ARUDO